MDRQRFDDLARAFAAPASRRSLLRAVAAMLFAAPVAAIGRPPLAGAFCGSSCGADEDCVDDDCAVCCNGVCDIECASGCAPEETDCFGACTDTNWDYLNCGDCGITCGPGETCEYGSCVSQCPPGLAVCCGGAQDVGPAGECCVDLGSDPYNCGGCGTSCASGRCSGGQCVTGCPEDLADCGGECVNLFDNPYHCGECFYSCDTGKCSAYRCITDCPPDSYACGPICCGTREPCLTDGGYRCGMACPPRMTDCGGVCVEYHNNPLNCGGCGIVCPSGQCVALECVPVTCPSGQVNCGDTCVDPVVDALNCGACGVVCANGRCADGVCVAGCSASQMLCGSVCVDTRSDPANCGECGQRCDPGQQCRDRRCVAPPTERLAITAFRVDAVAEEGACYDIEVELANRGLTASRGTIEVTEKPSYWLVDAKTKSKGPRDAYDGTDQRRDCASNQTTAAGQGLRATVTVPPDGTKTVAFRVSHDWDWVKPPSAVKDIFKFLLAVVPPIKGTSAAIQIIKAAVTGTRLVNSTVLAVHRTFEAEGWSPVARYAYLLKTEGFDLDDGVDPSRETRNRVPAWKIDALEASLVNTMASPFICAGGALLGLALVGLGSVIVGPAICGAVTLAGIVQYRTAYDPDSDYAAPVTPVPIRVEAVERLPAGGERACAQAALEALSLTTAAQRAAVKAVAAEQAGEANLHAAQLTAARAFMTAASAQADQVVQCVAMDGIGEVDPARLTEGFTPDVAAILEAMGLARADVEALGTAMAEAAPQLAAALTSEPALLPDAIGAFAAGLRTMAASFGVLFRADWGDELRGWSGRQGWQDSAAGLTNEGTRSTSDSWLAAPFRLGRLTRYAVEADIRLSERPDTCRGDRQFGIVARPGDSGAGYRAKVAVCKDEASLPGGAKGRYDVDTAWHTYRVEIRDRAVRFLIDGSLIVETTDARERTGGKVGLFSQGVPLEVRRFEVLALDPDEEPVDTPNPDRASPTPTAKPLVLRTPEPSPTPSAATWGELTVGLRELNDSGIGGFATLTAAGEETIVAIEVVGGAGGQLAHIHLGTCEALDPNPAFPLADIDTAGRSKTIVPIDLDDLLAGSYAINLHQSAAEIGVYVACGTIAAGS